MALVFLMIWNFLTKSPYLCFAQLLFNDEVPMFWDIAISQSSYALRLRCHIFHRSFAKDCIMILWSLFISIKIDFNDYTSMSFLVLMVSQLLQTKWYTFSLLWLAIHASPKTTCLHCHTLDFHFFPMYHSICISICLLPVSLRLFIEVRNLPQHVALLLKHLLLIQLDFWDKSCWNWSAHQDNWEDTAA